MVRIEPTGAVHAALVAWRNKSSTLLRILAPCIFIVLVLLLDFAGASPQQCGAGRQQGCRAQVH